MQSYGQKTSKMPQKWGFPPFVTPQDFFFKNRALSLLYPYGALTSCKTRQVYNGPRVAKFISAKSKKILSKVRKSAKTHKLCIIMLINPSSYNFLEKIIFDLQITIDRVNPVQISSCSDYCITTGIMRKTPKC